MPPSPYVATDVSVTETLPFETPTDVATTANHISLLTFDGLAGHRISLEYFNNTGPCAFDLSLYDTTDDPYPTGTSQTGHFNPDTISQSGPGGSVFDDRVLPYTGAYQIMLHACSTTTSSVTLTLHDVPPDITEAILTDGTAVPLNISVIGQDALLSFSEAAAHRVSLALDGVGIGGCSARTYVLNAGSETFTDSLASTCIGFMEPVPLPTTGGYRLFVDPLGSATGSITARLWDVPPDPTYATALNGTAVTVVTTTPGQNAQITFSGTSGQQATIHVTGSTMGQVAISLRNPDGSELTNWTAYSNGNFNVPTQTLPATGVYTIVVDPSGSNTGTLNVTVTNP